MDFELVPIQCTVNGIAVDVAVPGEMLLVDMIRDRLGLTGTHVGCDTTQCGACTVHVEGKAVKSCTMLAAQADRREVVTIEGIGQGGRLHPLQHAFREHHGLQCGFCTPGMIMSALDLLSRNTRPSESDVRHWLEGNICRCTGYQNIVAAVLSCSAPFDPAAAG
jgi:carbon-monoxide dehydrogenase small subunit